MRAGCKVFVRRHGPVPFIPSAAGDAMADGSRKEVFDLQTSSCDRPSESREHRFCYDESDLGTKYGERSSASLVGPPPASLGTLLQLTRGIYTCILLHSIQLFISHGQPEFQANEIYVCDLQS